MQTELVCESKLNATTESLLGRRTFGGRAIYLLSIAISAVAIASLPLVKVNVSVQSPGVIRPAIERQSIRARSSGYVAHVNVSRGKAVQRGDTLLVLDQDEVETRARHIKAQILETEKRILELSLLATISDSSDPSAKTTITIPLLRRQLLKHLAERDRRRVDLFRASEELERLTQLSNRDFAPKQEIEGKEREIEAIRADLRVVHEERTREWEAILAEDREKLRALRSQEVQLFMDRDRLSVLAPI